MLIAPSVTNALKLPPTCVAWTPHGLGPLPCPAPSALTGDSVADTLRDMPRDTTKTAFLTPAQAATRAGCGRTRVMKALHDKSLPASRDNQRRWQIDPADVDAWTADWPAPVSDTGAVSDPSRPNETVATLREEIAAVRATVVGLEARLADRDAEIRRLDAALQAALHRPTLLERLGFKRPA